jgi:septal ring factor EnvC (AmiA/AmiB activator)
MIQGSDITSASGIGAIALAAAVVLRSIINAWRSRGTKTSGPLTDMATLNTSQARSLKAEREENSRLRGLLAKAEQRNEQLLAELAQLRKEFDALNRHLADVEARLKKETT